MQLRFKVVSLRFATRRQSYISAAAASWSDQSNIMALLKFGADTLCVVYLQFHPVANVNSDGVDAVKEGAVW